MNEMQRQLIVARDGFACVVCAVDGLCAHRGKNDEPCKLPAPTLLPAVYFKIEKNRPGYMKLQVDHIIGRTGPIEVTEAWHNVITLCPCCHASKGQIREIEVAYAAQFEGKEPPEYVDAMLREASLAGKKKSDKAKARHASYKKQKAKAGGTPLSKTKGKKGTPAAGGKKYASAKWAAFDALPRFNSNP